MLRVPTFVAPSRISGVGLFSAQPIEEGAAIWEFTEGVDWVLSPSELLAFPEPFQSRLRHYTYLGDDGLYVLCGDNGKFMNHDEHPNCSDVDPVRTVALRSIEAGEELTCDYREFDAESRVGGFRFW